jgi:hypothetical protein
LAAAFALAGCDDDSGDGDGGSAEEPAGAPEVQSGKRGEAVVNEIEAPTVRRGRVALDSEAEPAELPNEDELSAALEESLSARGISAQAQADVNAAYQFTVEYGQQLLNSPGSGTAWVYRYDVPPGECVSLNAQNARCTIYIYSQELGTGHGGVDRWLRREHLIATRVGNNIYNTFINFVDFTGGQPICSDANIAGIPLCSPNGPS